MAYVKPTQSKAMEAYFSLDLHIKYHKPTNKKWVSTLVIITLGQLFTLELYMKTYLSIYNHQLVKGPTPIENLTRKGLGLYYTIIVDFWMPVIIVEIYGVKIKDYRNPSLGIVTKARVCKGTGQEGNSGVWESVRMNNHTPK
jgi:hypothetical protein